MGLAAGVTAEEKRLRRLGAAATESERRGFERTRVAARGQRETEATFRHAHGRSIAGLLTATVAAPGAAPAGTSHGHAG